MTRYCWPLKGNPQVTCEISWQWTSNAYSVLWRHNVGILKGINGFNYFIIIIYLSAGHQTRNQTPVFHSLHLSKMYYRDSYMGPIHRNPTVKYENIILKDSWRVLSLILCALIKKMVVDSGLYETLLIIQYIYLRHIPIIWVTHWLICPGLHLRYFIWQHLSDVAFSGRNNAMWLCRYWSISGKKLRPDTTICHCE